MQDRKKQRSTIPWRELVKLSHRGQTLALTTAKGKIKLTCPSTRRAAYIYSRGCSYNNFYDLMAKRNREAPVIPRVIDSALPTPANSGIYHFFRRKRKRESERERVALLRSRNELCRGTSVSMHFHVHYSFS